MAKEKKCCGCAKKVEVKPLTKTQIIAGIAEKAEMTKKDAAKALDALAVVIEESLAEDGAGSFTLPGLFKIEKKRVEAQPAKKGIRNPFKPGELMDRPAKPAHNKIKVKALKGLKEMA